MSLADLLRFDSLKICEKIHLLKQVSICSEKNKSHKLHAWCQAKNKAVNDNLTCTNIQIKQSVKRHREVPSVETFCVAMFVYTKSFNEGVQLYIDTSAEQP